MSIGDCFASSQTSKGKPTTRASCMLWKPGHAQPSTVDVSRRANCGFEVRRSAQTARSGKFRPAGELPEQLADPASGKDLLSSSRNGNTLCRRSDPFVPAFQLGTASLWKVFSASQTYSAMGGTRLGFRHRDRTIGDGTPLIPSARIPYDVPENLNSDQYDFARDDCLARCRIPVGRRQRQASGT